MKYYIVTFDRKNNFSYKEFHNGFVGHSDIKRWFHYIGSSYIIGTNMTVQDLSNHFISVAQKYGIPTTHLALRVVLRERQGMLTKDAWNWLKDNTTVY